MSHLFVVLVSSALFLCIEAEVPHSLSPDAGVAAQDGYDYHFQPTLAIAMGFLSLMFLLSLFVLLRAKCFHQQGESSYTDPGEITRLRSQFLGLDRSVIDLLPLFRFSSLGGLKDGLECAVCLSKFEDTMILRLLPKCNHAFHVGCIDRWLGRNSSCPLCRSQVSPEDVIFDQCTDTSIENWSPSDRRESSNREFFVQREEEEQCHGPSRLFDIIGSSFRKISKRNDKDRGIAFLKGLHRFNHKIVATDFVFRNRWSNASCSDLMVLNSEMISAMSSNRFTSCSNQEEHQIVKIKEEMEMRRLVEAELWLIKPDANSNSCVDASAPTIEDTSSSALRHGGTPEGRRSMSDITTFSRFGDMNMATRYKLCSSLEHGNAEERTRRAWLEIARRTVEWFANRERSQVHDNSAPMEDV